MNELPGIKKRWLSYTPHELWGDSLDVRFYLLARLKKLRKRQILDVGCSIGMVLSKLDTSNIKCGFDMNCQALTLARDRNPTAYFLKSSLFEGFPYQDNSFDAVIMANVMPYHEIVSESLEKAVQKKTVFSEVYRVLKPGGTLFLTTPNGEHLCYRHTQRIHLSELQHDIESFRNVRIYGWNPFPSFIFFLPDTLKRCIPIRYQKYLFMPSSVLAKFPYMMDILQYLMTKKSLLKKAKAFYVECEK
jgi:SAM-dependent methyltransferase